MPLTAGGKLTIIASSGLGGLGASNGAPVEYNWVLPGVAPLLLPWAVILGLLALKPNRRAAAWLIWLPLVCLVVSGRLLWLLPANLLSPILDILTALAFGLAAVWLLVGYLSRQHRLVTFICMVFVLVFFAVLAFVAAQGWSATMQNLFMVVILLVISAVATEAALTLCGWFCRGRWHPLRLYPGLLLTLAIVWLAGAAPFFISSEMSNHWRNSWSEFFLVMLFVAAVNFLILLPFLILSSASPFYRQRLKVLLHVQTEALPPRITPTPEANLKA